jgi:metal-responsive CopG/Arc/MetJ family transcriptional regulator
MSDDVRMTILLPPQMAQQVSDYWHTNRLPSRSEAIRELLEAALAAQKPAKIRKSA